MPNFPQPQRQDEPAVTDADLAALLAGKTDAVPGLRPVADVLAALTTEATGAELAGEARALAEFRRRSGVPIPPQRARRGPAGLTSRLGFKVGASVTAVAVVFGGGAAAAFADVLPAPIQRLAHEAIGAPVPPRHGLPGRDGPAAHGQHAGPGKPAVRGGPGAKRQGRPHATPAPTAQGNPHAKGKHGKSPHGQQGQGNGQGNGSGHGQGNGQSQGQSQQGNPHKKGPQASPRVNRRPAGHPRQSVRTRPIMDP